jgi:hypothetical protein
MGNLQLEHNSGQWMLFNVSAKFSLKSVLLHFGNMFPSVTMVQAVHMKKTRTSIFRFCRQKYATNNTGGINVLT